MSNTDQLISYILTLTPEQADKVIRQFPLFAELINKTPALYADYLKRTIFESIYRTTDEGLLTCIHALLMNEVNPEKQQAVS